MLNFWIHNKTRDLDTVSDERRSDSDNDFEKKDKNVTFVRSIGAEDATSLRDDVFAKPDEAKIWSQLYEKSQYENRHLLDPELEWSRKEERRVLWKTDLHATLFAFIAFLALDVDRYNFANAITGSLFDDVGITTDDYNLGSTVNLVCFLGAELPSNIISKWIGPDRWIPIQMTLWSVVAMCQSKMTNRSSFLACRALVGMLEGGFIPDIGLWLSYFYTGPELAFRVGLFYIANPLIQAFSSLLAFAIFHIEGHTSLKGWQWIFIIEGAVTLLIGLLAFFLMPPSPSQTRTWFRRKGWFTRREEKIVVNRVLRDDPTKGTMNNRTPLTLKQLLNGILSWEMYPMYFIRLIGDMPTGPVGAYLPIILRQPPLSFGTLDTNLLMIPKCFIAIITLVTTSYLTFRFNHYIGFLALTPLWHLPFLCAMRWWPDFLKNSWSSYAILTLALGGPQVTAMSVPWVSQNSGDVAVRTVSGALVNIMSQVSGIVSSNVFRKDDAPYYHRGLTQMIAVCIASGVLMILSFVWYRWLNHRKEKKWNAMSNEEQLDYLESTTDVGFRRLDFRWSY